MLKNVYFVEDYAKNEVFLHHHPSHTAMNQRRRKFILALGSNASPDQSMAKAKELLQEQFGPLAFTPVITTEGIGMVADSFSNCLAYGMTPMTADELTTILKQMERDCGDQPALRAAHQIVMDIDLLLLGRKRYHTDDWNRDYIRRLLAMPTSKNTD